MKASRRGYHDIGFCKKKPRDQLPVKLEQVKNSLDLNKK